MTADLLAEVVRRIEAQTIIDPNLMHAHIHMACPAHCEKGRILDPAFAPLLEAVTTQLPRRHMTSVRVVRIVEALDTGALLEAMAVIGTPVSCSISGGQATVWFGDADAPLFERTAPTLKEAALNALIAALEVKADAS